MWIFWWKRKFDWIVKVANLSKGLSFGVRIHSEWKFLQTSLGVMRMIVQSSRSQNAVQKTRRCEVKGRSQVPCYYQENGHFSTCRKQRPEHGKTVEWNDGSWNEVRLINSLPWKLPLPLLRKQHLWSIAKRHRAQRLKEKTALLFFGKQRWNLLALCGSDGQACFVATISRFHLWLLFKRSFSWLRWGNFP